MWPASSSSTAALVVLHHWHRILLSQLESSSESTEQHSAFFDQCSTQCGWVAAVIAALAYGTFGVPIKETVSVPDAHPLVLQSYKTVTMFAMAWLIILMGESVRFTPWGLLSGLLWVVGGSGGILAIRCAGMSVAVGTWSSCMVIINFVVGIVFFQEPVASMWSTFAAFLCLGLGLVGMSVYSSPSSAAPCSASSAAAASGGSSDSNNPLMGAEETLINSGTSFVPPSNGTTAEKQNQVVTNRMSPSRSRSNESLELVVGAAATATAAATANYYDPLRDPQLTAAAEEANGDGIWRRYDNNCGKKEEERFVIFNSSNNNNNNNPLWSLSKRQVGILGAVMNGVLTGSSLVPIHYAKKQGFGGAAYMLSFATGALLSNSLIWVLWFVGKLLSLATATTTTTPTPTTATGCSTRSMVMMMMIQQTYDTMPSWHFRQLYVPGFCAGILLAIAMFGSIMSVTYLGQGVGNSIIQSKILVSGLWGIFWYREIVGVMTITKWFASASLAVVGILWLSYERIHAARAEDAE